MGHDFIDSSMVKVVPSHFSPPSLSRKQRAEVFYVQGVLVCRVFRKIFNVVSDGLPVGFFQADIGGVDQSRGNVRLQNRMIMSMSFHISLSAFAEDHRAFPRGSAPPPPAGGCG